VDKAIVTRPWHATTKTIDLWKHHDATVMVFINLFSFICFLMCFISFNVICVQVELADYYLLLRLHFIPKHIQTQHTFLLTHKIVNLIFTDNYSATF